jgi:enoyl-CoA hydratase
LNKVDYAGEASSRPVAFPVAAMNFETIRVRAQNSFALVTLNRPGKLNAMSMMMKAELIRAFQELDRDDKARAIVVTGAGEKAFTAGADILEFQARRPMEQWRMHEHGTLYDAVDRVSKPILAMINGYCFGGGLELAMACDLRIASDRATLGQTEINIGIIPGGGGSQRLPRLVGLGNALRLTLTGDRIDAAEAHRMGLVDEVVPHANLEPRTFEIATKIAGHSALAVRLAKAAVRASIRLPLDQGLRYEQGLFALVMASADKEEGVRAFLEKREPKWSDR